MKNNTKVSNDLLLSIIIPVYNTELYLKDCLDSCLWQDLLKEKYEIICINDGSTDSSAQILDSYQINYPNIRVINQENSGVSSARNNGLRVSKGKYVWFIDSDDYIRKNSLKTIINFLEKHTLDAITVKYFKVNSQMHREKKYHNRPIKVIKKDTVYYVWRWIVKSEILHKNEISFNIDMSYAEDALWVYYLERHLKYFYYTNFQAYYCRIRNNSLLNTYNEEANNKKINSMIAMAKAYQSELNHIDCQDASLLENTRIRKDMSAQAALIQAALHKNRIQQKSILDDLVGMGLYPYKLIWYNLRPKKCLKQTLIGFSIFLFPIRSYYLFFCSFVSFIKKRRVVD